MPQSNVENWRVKVPRRFVVCAMCTAFVLSCCMQRRVFMLTIKTLLYSDLPKRTYSQCPRELMEWERQLVFVHNRNSKYVWGRSRQQSVSNFFRVGHLLILIPAGMCMDHYGPKSILGWGVFLSSLFNLMYPPIMEIDYYLILMTRFVQGMGQGVLWPGVGAMVARWSPLSEISTFLAVVQSARFFSKGVYYMIPMFFETFIPYWEVMFYAGGVSGIILCGLWYKLVYSSPERDPNITEEEKNRIVGRGGFGRHHGKLRPISILVGLLKSRAVVSVVIFDFGCQWVYFTAMRSTGAYLIHFIGLPQTFMLQCSTFYEIALMVSVLFSAVFSDWLINNDVISRTKARKLFGTAGCALVLSLLFASSVVGCDTSAVISLFTCLFYVAGCMFGGYRANVVEVSPRHAGTVYGIVQIGTSFAFLFTTMVIDAVSNKADATQWRQLYLVTTIVFLVCSVPYLLFGTAEVQSSNISQKSESDEESETGR